MIRALNQDNINQTGRSLAMFAPAKPLTLEKEGALVLEPAEAKLRPLLKGALAFATIRG